MNVISEFRNDLLKRKEMIFSDSYDSNPGFAQVGKDVASETKADEAVVVVRGIKSEFGSNEFIVDAFVYDSIKDKEKIEPKKKEKKK